MYGNARLTMNRSKLVMKIANERTARTAMTERSAPRSLVGPGEDSRLNMTFLLVACAAHSAASTHSDAAHTRIWTAPGPDAPRARGVGGWFSAPAALAAGARARSARLR